MAYIGTVPIPQSNEVRQEFLIDTASQSTFYTRTNYVPQFIEVYKNGLRLQTADFTATNGYTVTLATPAVLNDVVAIEYRINLQFNTNNQLELNPGGSSVIDSQGFDVLYEDTGGAVTLTADEANVGNNALVVDASGNVGIGTSSPSQKLSVAGNAMLQTDQGFLYLSNVGTGNSGIYVRGTGSTNEFRSHSTGTFTWEITGLEKMRIDSSGNVGIGTDSPTTNTILHLKDTDTQIELEGTNGSNSGFIDFDGTNLQFSTSRNMISGVFSNTGKSNATITLAGSSGGSEIRMYTASGNNTTGTQKMKIDGSGKSEFFGAGVYALQGNGVTSQSFRVGADDRWKIRPNNGNQEFCLEYAESTSLSDANIKLKVENTGSAYNSTGTWGTLPSDIRVKENIVDATSKLNDLLNLRVVNFNLINNQEKLIGFIAQEFQEIFPNLVTTYDTREYDENGNIVSGYEDMLGLKVGVEFAVVVKAIQEQQALIESQQSQIDALTARIEALEAGN